MTPKSNPFEPWLARAGGIFLAICTVYGVIKDIVHRSPNGAGPTGFLRLATVLILGVCTAIAYGVLWQAFENIFGWKYGAGGHGRLPQGWAAVALSFSVTLPLVLIPLPYQAATGVLLLNPASHWTGSIS